mgnify:CR=1 FL=1
MISLSINNSLFNVHPIYDLYAADKNGNIINITNKVLLKGNKKRNGYLKCSVRGYKGVYKSCHVHRFVWECFNGIIKDGKVIDHINNNIEDNSLDNLQLVTHQENCKKSAINRDYNFTKNNYKNKRCIKAINIANKEELYFNTISAVQQNLGINAGVIKNVCESNNYYKTGKSKINNNIYNFHYIKREDLPESHIRCTRTGLKRTRLLTKEEKILQKKEAIKKWQNKEFKCEKCNKTYKNSYRYLHLKRCL